MTLLKYIRGWFKDKSRIRELERQVHELTIERNRYKEKYNYAAKYIEELSDDIHSYEDGE